MTCGQAGLKEEKEKREGRFELRELANGSEGLTDGHRYAAVQAHASNLPCQGLPLRGQLWAHSRDHTNKEIKELIHDCVSPELESLIPFFLFSYGPDQCNCHYVEIFDLSGPWKRKKRTGTEGKVDREADNVWSKGLRACAPHGVHFPQFLLSHNVCKSEATIDGQSTKKQRNKGTYLPVNLSLRSTQCVTIQSLFFFFLGPQHTKYKRLRDRPRNRKRIKETECLSLRLRPAHKRL